MNIETQFKIKNDPMLQRYIRDHSFWYKYLNRNPGLITKMTEEMKKEYKLTTSDKINDFSEKLTLIQTFLNMMK